MRILLLSILLTSALRGQAQAFQPTEIVRWQQQARQVTITRDTWGVPHVSGKTDADAVFGLLYAQCEDDFARVEANYLDALGRRAEIEGEKALYGDLRARMFMDSTRAITEYARSPAWLRELLQAFADGTNYYLHTHPQTRPQVLRRFQPWMPLLFSEGSIGGNISVVPLAPIEAFYSARPAPGTGGMLPQHSAPGLPLDRASLGSNGFAIAPALSAGGYPLLLINPHTSFYFRPEVQMTSQAGLNAYGAVTWGQFFIYQGFNEHCGWMHTSSSADTMDEYLETVSRQPEGRYTYRYGPEQRPVQEVPIRLAYRTANGTLQHRQFTTYRTHHGPVVGRQADDKWLTVRMMDAPVAALEQSYLRTKATDYASFREVLKRNGNASNNTVFADTKGTIAYWHGNFMPRRDPQFDWSRPVDGSDPRTEWQGLHEVAEIVQVKNPASGWLQNCNATPFTVAGPGSSPAPAAYPAYMAPDAENYRGLNAVRILGQKARSKFTLDTLLAAARDPHLTAFDELLPALAEAYQTAADGPDAPRGELKEAMQLLQTWDHNYAATSVAQTVATYWAERLLRLARPRLQPGQPADWLHLIRFSLTSTTAPEKVSSLQETLDELTATFGNWRQPWGAINRFQRLTGRIDEVYDDKKPSLPVAFTSSAWGSLAAFGSKARLGTQKRYGDVGNSFVAVVELGPRIKARSVLAGGVSGHPVSPHFRDQASRYVEQQFKDIWFYPEDIRQHAERTYSPGQR